MKYAWIEKNRGCFPVRTMCEVLEVSSSGLHAARTRGPSKRTLDNERLIERIRASHRSHRGRYGRRRMTAEVREATGRVVNEKRVGRLMREHGLQSHKRRRFRVVTTDSRHSHPIAANVLQRDFVAPAPNRKWLADITYVPSAEGWLYAAFVLDLFSRKIVGWAMSSTMPQTLTLSALQVALGWRDPEPGQLVHHSDRGSQYAAEDYRKALAARGIEVSMSGKGDCWDNAPMESFNGTLKVECVHGERFETREQARQALVEFVGYYNTERRHSSLGNVAPALYEQRWHERVNREHRAADRRGAARPPHPRAEPLKKSPTTQDTEGRVMAVSDRVSHRNSRR